MTNYSSPLSTASNFRKLYIVTGKGGVGKTTLSIALAKYLESQGKKVLYSSFDSEPPVNMLERVGVDYLSLTVDECATDYIAQKLGSHTIAKWIMKTPFFHSLLHMLPGLGQMILLGDLIHLLEQDDDLVVVMDSPSSGHAITMFEASKNFKDIFGNGMIVEDINRMHNFIYGQNALSTIVCCLPTVMAYHEGLELQQSIQAMGHKDTQIVINDALCPILAKVDPSEIPDFLKKKVEQEKQVSSEGEGKIEQVFQHHPLNLPENIIKAMVDEVGGALA